MFKISVKSKFQSISKKKRKIILIISAVIMALAAVIILIFVASSNQNNATEFLEKQGTTIQSIKKLSNETAKVYTLYFSDIITGEEFANEIKLLKLNLIATQADYYAKKEKANIVGDIPYAVDRGLKAIEKMFTNFEDLYENSFIDNDFSQPIDAIALSYYYTKINDKTIELLGEYTAAEYLLDSTDSSDSD